MSGFRLTPSDLKRIDWRQPFSAIARQERASVACAWQSWRRSGKSRGSLTPRARREITARIEAARKEGRP